jgi:beta-lactamase class A
MRKVLLALLFLCGSLTAGDTAANKADLLWAKLAGTITALDKDFDGVVGVSILDLTDQHEWNYHADEVFPTASTIKLAVLAELYRQEEQARQGKPGNVRLMDTYIVRKKDVVADSAVLGNLTPGKTVLTNRDLAGAVVAVSDNSASNILTSRLGMDGINATLERLGLTQTRMRRLMMDLDAARQGRENVATPHELVKLLTALYNDKVFGPELHKDFFDLLTTSKSSQIPRLLPEELKIANKPGALAGVRCDAGIVFVPNRPFAIAVMTAYDRDERAAEQLIAQVARLAWQMFDVLSVSSEYGRQITERNSH